MQETAQPYEPYADNFVPVVPVDYTYHTPQNPFCWDSECSCHTGKEATAQVHQEYKAGLLTAEEALLTIEGKTL